MNCYINRTGESGIKAFKIGVDFIDVLFKDGWIYTYDYNSAGSAKIEKMKELALRGMGLNSFINLYARKLFSLKRRY